MNEENEATTREDSETTKSEENETTVSAKVLCFASSKGGSGKTIITANIASFLTGIGKKCLIIDCDAATHGMSLLYITDISNFSDENRKGLFDFSNPEEITEKFEDNLVTVENGVALLPATYRFTTNFDPESKAEKGILKHIVEIMRPQYDFIFLDAQAGSDMYSRIAVNEQISDEVIIVSEYDPLSSAGVERLKQVVGEDLSFARTWILLNKMLPEFVEKFSEFLSVTKYLPPIPWNAKVVRAYAKRELALDLERGNEFTLAIMGTIKVLMGKSIDSDLNLWLQNRTYTLREPLEEQYKDAEMELISAFEAKNRLERRNRFNLLLKVYMGAGVGIAAITFGLSDLTSVLRVNNPFSEMMMVVFSLLLMLPVLLWASSFWMGRKTAESARYDRIITTLEEKLKQLEALRSADYETIVKGKDSSLT